MASRCGKGTAGLVTVLGEAYEPETSNWNEQLASSAAMLAGTHLLGTDDAVAITYAQQMADADAQLQGRGGGTWITQRQAHEYGLPLHPHKSFLGLPAHGTNMTSPEAWYPGMHQGFEVAPNTFFAQTVAGDIGGGIWRRLPSGAMSHSYGHRPHKYHSGRWDRHQPAPGRRAGFYPGQQLASGKHYSPRHGSGPWTKTMGAGGFPDDMSPMQVAAVLAKLIEKQDERVVGLLHGLCDDVRKGVSFSISVLHSLCHACESQGHSVMVYAGWTDLWREAVVPGTKALGVAIASGSKKIVGALGAAITHLQHPATVAKLPAAAAIAAKPVPGTGAALAKGLAAQPKAPVKAKVSGEGGTPCPFDHSLSPAQAGKVLATLVRKGDPRAATVIHETGIMAHAGNEVSGATLIAMLHDLASDGGTVSVMGADDAGLSLMDKVKAVGSKALAKVKAGASALKEDVSAAVDSAINIVTSSPDKTVAAASKLSQKVDGAGPALHAAITAAGKKPKSKQGVEEEIFSMPTDTDPNDGTQPTVIELPAPAPWYTMAHWRK